MDDADLRLIVPAMLARMGWMELALKVLLRRDPKALADFLALMEQEPMPPDQPTSAFKEGASDELRAFLTAPWAERSE